MPGIADPAASGQLKRNETGPDLAGSIQACAGGAEATRVGCTFSSIRRQFEEAVGTRRRALSRRGLELS